MTGSFTGQTSLLVNGVRTIKNTQGKQSCLFSGQKSLGLGKLGNLMVMINRQSAERVILKNKNRKKETNGR